MEIKKERNGEKLNVALTGRLDAVTAIHLHLRLNACIC